MKACALYNVRKSPKAASKKSKESRVWPLGGAPKDMETLDYTKDKDIGESPLPQQAVYLPDPKVILEGLKLHVRHAQYLICFVCFHTQRLLVLYKEKFGIWILNPNRKKKKKKK